MQPAQATEHHEKRKPSEVLSHYVHRLRYVLWGILGLAVVFLIAYFVYTEVNKRLATQSTALTEEVQDLFDKWSAEGNADKKAALEKDILERADKVIARYPRQYGAERALFIRASVRFDGKAWDDASKDYETLAKRFPRSYLAPVALFDAAVCLEEKGDAAGAESFYMSVVNGHKGSAVVPRALFAAGRIDEGKGAFDDARKKYETLDTDHPQSGWTRLAKNRIIALKVEGKIK
jgi:TolA-binding protein